MEDLLLLVGIGRELLVYESLKFLEVDHAAIISVDFLKKFLRLLLIHADSQLEKGVLELFEIDFPGHIQVDVIKQLANRLICLGIKILFLPLPLHDFPEFQREFVVGHDPAVIGVHVVE